MTDEGMIYRAFFSFLSVAALAVVIMVFALLFIDTIISVKDESIDRAAVQLEEVLFTSELTIEIGVLNRTQLDTYNNTFIEPFAKHCSYGYMLSVEDLYYGEEWIFGYGPGINKPDINKIDSATVKSYVAIKNGTTVFPAETKLWLFDTWATRISCIMEKAYNSGKVYQIELPRNKCSFIIEKQGSDICFVTGRGEDCRHSNVDSLTRFQASCSSNRKKQLIRAVPLNSLGLTELNAGHITNSCDTIDLDDWAANGANIETIILCMEDAQR